MKFTVDRQQFTKEVGKFLPFVERKTTIPILANVLFVAGKDSLTITATDLGVSLVSEFKAQIEAKGSISVPLRKLADTLKKMSTLEATTITISVVDNWVHLTCGDFAVKLVGMEAKNFPALPKKPKGGVKIPASVLETLITKTRFAISDEESRYTITGALLIVEPTSVSMITTDGHRLAHVERNSSTFNVPEAQESLITSAALDRLKPFIDRGMELPVTLAKDENGTQFFSVHPNYTIIAKPVTAKFPNWKAVLPQGNGKDITVDSKQFAAVVSRVSQFANERSMACRFELVVNKGLEVSASSTEDGSASELIKAPCEDSVSIGFDARYVLDILKAMDGPVTMKLKDSQSSALFVPATPSEYKFQVVQMPVRL